MNKEIKIKTIGQLLDYVETEQKAKELIDYITNLQQEIERLNNIIKEVRELLKSKKHCERLLGGVEGKTFTEQLLEILDKGE